MYDLHLFVSLMLWLLLIAVYRRSQCASAFHPLTYYLFFHGLVFVIRPVFQHYLGFDTVYNLYGFWPSPETKQTALAITNLGLICFFFGALAAGNVRMKFPSVEELRYRIRPRRAAVMALLIALPLIVLSLRYDLSANFGSDDLRNLERDAATFHTIYTDNTAYLVEANVMLGAFGVMIAWVYRFRLIATVPFAIFVLLRISIGWSRWTFIMAGSSFALLYLFDRRRKWPGAWTVGAGVSLLLVFSLLSSQRDAVASWLLDRESENADYAIPSKHFFDRMDFADLEFVEYIVDVVPEKTGGYNYFANSLEVFTAPIPRVLWPGKPVGPPLVFFNINNYGFPVGITWTLVGEGWQSLGFAGVILWCSMAGVLWGRIYRWFVMHNNSMFVTLYYLLLLPLSLQWFRDGVLLTLLKFPLFFMLPIAFTQVLTWLGVRTPAFSRRGIRLGVGS
jgi:O-antigen polysaccharide polymerase Wzy